MNKTNVKTLCLVDSIVAACSFILKFVAFFSGGRNPQDEQDREQVFRPL